MNASRSLVLLSCTCPACGCRHLLPESDVSTFGRLTECGPCLDADSRLFEGQLLGEIEVREAGPGVVRLIAQTLDGHRWSYYITGEATQETAQQAWRDHRGSWVPFVF